METLAAQLMVMAAAETAIKAALVARVIVQGLQVVTV
jgi:hypothetical protein